MWGVPADHEMFSNISSVQWMWYFYNFMEDNDESFTDQRDLVEYHASFIEPEAVMKVREARDTAVEVPHDEFVAGIEYFFGRGISLPQQKRKGSETIAVDPKEAIKKAKDYKEKETTDNTKPGKLDYAHWLDVDLE